MDIPERFRSNIFAIKILPIVGISTIGDGLSLIYANFTGFFVIKDTF